MVALLRERDLEASAQHPDSPASPAQVGNLVIGLLTAVTADGRRSWLECASSNRCGTVLITGASAGIGRELAVQIAPRADAHSAGPAAGRLEEMRTTLVAKHRSCRY